MGIILASESLFRGKALEILGLSYETIPSRIDEDSIKGRTPSLTARKTAEAKVAAVAAHHPHALIIAGDLFIGFNGRKYDKPASMEKAFAMLRSFSGKEIYLIAVVAVYDPATKAIQTDVGVTHIKFRTITSDEIWDYLSRYPVLKCAAAFESDGLLRFGRSVHGDYPPLHGLPLPQLIALLRTAGVEV